MLKNTKKRGHMFIMIEFMKKEFKIVICCALAVCVTVVAFFCGVKSSQDDIVFELSYDYGTSEYYVLKEDNTLIWAYGDGRQDGFTYSMFFSSVNEQGFVKVSDEDAKEMKRNMKKAVKCYRQVESDSSCYVLDEVEIILKYKNRYYNNDFLKKEYENENIDKYLSIYDIRKEMKRYVKKYKEMGAYVYYD